MSRQSFSAVLSGTFPWLAGRRAFVAFVALAAVMVIAAAGAIALATGTIGERADDTAASGQTAAYDGAVAPASEPGALSAPEERSAESGASTSEDARGGGAAPPAVGQGATAGADADGTSGTPLPSLDAGRTVIRNGGVDITVEAVADAFERVRQIATALGGYVGDSSFNGAGDHQSAYLTIRVPAERFGDAISQIRGLAVKVESVTTNARDVTEEFSDLEAALRNLRAVEQRYVELLGRAESIADILLVQDRLNQVRFEIDRIEGRRQLIASQADLATLAVTLRPVITGEPVVEATRGPLDAAADAWQASLNTLSALATGVLVVVVYSWWIVPPALVLAAVIRRLWRRREPVAAGTTSD